MYKILENKVVWLVIFILSILFFLFLLNNEWVKLSLDKDWNNYINKELNFEINYPNKEYPLGKLKYINSISSVKNNHSIILSDGGSTQISINVKNSKYKSINEIISEMSIIKKENLILDKRQISNNEAFFYYYDLGGNYLPTDKNYRDVFVTTLVILKKEKLYTITTANIKKDNCFKLWDSFKFLDSEKSGQEPFS